MKRPFYGHVSTMPWKATPLSWIILGLATLIAVASGAGTNREMVGLLLIAGPGGVGDPIYRWISPIFLHFGWTHLIFNALWLYAVGRLIEWRSLPWFAAVVVMSALGGNVLQLVVSGPGFGGLSGVVYGVLGYVFIWDRLRPDAYGVPKAYIGLALGFLALGLSGLDALLGMRLANFAHLGGLLGGVAVAFIHTQLARGR